MASSCSLGRPVLSSSSSVWQHARGQLIQQCATRRGGSLSSRPVSVCQTTLDFRGYGCSTLSTSSRLSTSRPSTSRLSTSRLSTTRISTRRISTSSSKETAMETEQQHDHILTLSCADRPGIVHAVTGILADSNMNILDSQQFSDPTTRRFFMRVHFGAVAGRDTAEQPSLQAPFAELAARMQMDLTLRPVAQRPRLLLMVSKIGHCLHDLLYKHSTGQLPVEIPLIVSNHGDMATLAANYGIPYRHLPVTADTKLEQERQILDAVAEHSIDCIVLARYMQVLTPGLCAAMSGRIINIHHSFLPSFKGARPYHQAYERGVKVIGATAHFVTAELDEGPIIEQRVTAIDHSMGARELVDEGSNVESQVLAAAVKWFAESRVLLNGHKTVVFK